jgi:choline dehydrogenase-like flavoprotein
MIDDARTLPDGDTVDTDICIIGAGPAGITLARELVGEKFRVCLLEGGGLEVDGTMESLTRGENVGLPYERLNDARLRSFGGNSQIWSLPTGDSVGLRLRPLDPIDFEKRDWVPYSGWPFGYEALEPYYKRAHDVFRIGPFDYDVASWEDPAARPRLPFQSERVRTVMFQFGRAEHFYSDYRDEIYRAPNVTAYLYANVVELELNESGSAIDRVKVACLPGGTVVLIPSGHGFQRMRVAPMPESRFWVKAKLFILAAGGTENPRLLLASNARHPKGIGNQHDLVGRFFMEHPHLWSGRLIPRDGSLFERTGLYHPHSANGLTVMAKLALTEEVLRREELLSYCVSIHPHAIPEGVRSLAQLAAALRRGKLPQRAAEHLGNVAADWREVMAAAYGKFRRKLGAAEAFKRKGEYAVFRLNHMSEQVPNPSSRITLADERDPLGVPRVKLDWRLDPQDIHTIVRAQEILDEELRRAGLGRLQIDHRDEAPPADIHGGWHHMGTTRMHNDPKQGVVNEHCKVHGVANLFVAGSSVFPTGGYANPTLTIGALAIRLADHVKKEMAGAVRLKSEKVAHE